MLTPAKKLKDLNNMDAIELRNFVEGQTREVRQIYEQNNKNGVVHFSINYNTMDVTVFFIPLDKCTEYIRYQVGMSKKKEPDSILVVITDEENNFETADFVALI